MFRRFALAACLVIATGTAAAEPVLEVTSPSPTSYEYLTDFKYLVGTGFGEVTRSLQAVGPVLLPGIAVGGCDAVDFSGFVAGSIALIERGGCNFSEKVDHATAAGAAGVLIFNSGVGGDAGILAFDGTMGDGVFASIPVFALSYGAGLGLYTLVQSGPVTVHMRILEEDVPAAVPEPGSLALAGLALAGLALVRRRSPA